MKNVYNVIRESYKNHTLLYRKIEETTILSVIDPGGEPITHLLVPELDWTINPDQSTIDCIKNQIDAR